MTNWIQRLPTIDPGAVRAAGQSMVVVDGGATRCRVAVTDLDGNLAGFALSGPTNWRSVGVEGATRNLVVGIGAALADGGVDPASVALTVVTSAAIDTDGQADQFSDAVRRSLGIGGEVSTLPDTMGCWASTNALGPATAVISGTGSSVVAADRNAGTWRRFGGWDYILGDEGSGYGIGRQALRVAMFHSEGRADAVAIHDAVLRHAGLADAEELPTRVHTPHVDKAWIADFAPVVFDLADAGDRAALAVLADEADLVGAACAAGIDSLGHDDAVLGLFGGTFRCLAWRAAFESSVQRQTERTVRMVVPEHSALVGAFSIGLGCAGTVNPAELDRAGDRLATAVAARIAQDQAPGRTR